MSRCLAAVSMFPASDQVVQSVLTLRLPNAEVLDLRVELLMTLYSSSESAWETSDYSQ